MKKAGKPIPALGRFALRSQHRKPCRCTRRCTGNCRCFKAGKPCLPYCHLNPDLVCDRMEGGQGGGGGGGGMMHDDDDDDDDDDADD